MGIINDLTKTESKVWQPAPSLEQQQKRSRVNFRGHVLVLGLVCLICWYLIPSIDLTPFSHSGLIPQDLGSENVHSDLAQAEFSWDSIEPTTELDLVPCFKRGNITFQCALLDVPMDWHSNTSEKRVHVAVIRLPAPVDVTDERYGGPILINPGGPGGSGVSAAMRFGSSITSIVNTADKVFDVVSFDPRGVNNTRPRLSCFPDSSSSDVWRLEQEALGVGSDAVGAVWSRSRALAMACLGDTDQDGLIEHMNTPVVVADMVAIIESLGRWREREALRILIQKGVGEDGGRVISETKREEGREKIQYWGFSYGTVLGATFAALEPDRVQRMILDGVVEMTDYYTNTWNMNLLDTDAAMDNFYIYCAQAGPSKCAMNTGQSSPKDIQKSLESFIEDLKEEPLAVWGVHGPEIITYSDVRQLVRPALYKPLAAFPEMAAVLADAIHGNGTKFAAWKARGHEPSCPLQCGSRGARETECGSEVSTWEAMMAIHCSDAPPGVSNKTIEWFREERGRLLEQSAWLGEWWASIPLSCVAWKGKAAWKVTPDEIRGNTSHPLLLIGNTFDPVTPLANAHSLSTQFPGSMVLQQNSEGHCTLAAPSLCTAKHIRNYFQTGELPPLGVVCQPEERPLVGRVAGEGVDAYSEDEWRMVEAMRQMGAASRNAGPLSPL